MHRLCVQLPVWDIDTNDARLQQLSMLVSAGGQQPALVMGQTVANKQDVVLLRRLSKRLPELGLLVFHWSQNEGRRVQTQTLGPLHEEQTLVYKRKQMPQCCIGWLSLKEVTSISDILPLGS